MHNVEGYIDPLDALIFCELISTQTNSGHKGALFEIGVYYGRSFFLLDLLRRDDEGLLGVDIFRTHEDQFGRGHQKKKVIETAIELGARAGEINLLEGDSSKLEYSDILARLGKVRFVHIDGGHLTEHVLADSLLSAEIISNEGIICFDDFFNTEWPEVTTACLEFLKSQKELVPFLISDKKLYVCPNASAEGYRKEISLSSRLETFHRNDRVLLDQPVTVLSHPIHRRIIYEAVSKTPLRGLTRHLYL